MSDQQHDSGTDGVEHLQTAAREVIAAARSFLDAAEPFVADPERMRSVASVAERLLAEATAAVDRRGATRSRGDAEPDGRLRRFEVD